ncbi:MAG: metalloregulator ArsR/SmtB family transcription factor [Bacilli bacterium]|jgi:DNA-binding transcriptional ArsR family regulator|nr:metalloregulator ArsR/SmtB family transcription factor [Bacilli bacterium]
MEKDEIEVCQEYKAHKDVVASVKDKMLTMDEFNKLGNLYSVFSDPMRIRIIYALFEENMCVCDLSESLGATQSNISHHLAILKANDLVTFKKKGKQVIYSLKDEHVKAIFFMGLEHIREKNN